MAESAELIETHYMVVVGEYADMQMIGTFTSFPDAKSCRDDLNAMPDRTSVAAILEVPHFPQGVYRRKHLARG